jgi:hypothetical protein
MNALATNDMPSTDPILMMQNRGPSTTKETTDMNKVFACEHEYCDKPADWWVKCLIPGDIDGGGGAICNDHLGIYCATMWDDEIHHIELERIVPVTNHKTKIEREIRAIMEGE